MTAVSERQTTGAGGVSAATGHQGHPPTSTGVTNEKLAMWIFLGSECLLFGALISTYFLYRGRSVAGPTPKQIYDIPYTSASPLARLMSSLPPCPPLSAIHPAAHRRARVSSLRPPPL